MINSNITAKKINKTKYMAVARIFKLCACHTSVIQKMTKYLDEIMSYVDIFITSPLLSMLQVRYPAVIVSLDLTASEMCIERVSQMVKNKNILKVVFREVHLYCILLHESLVRKIIKNAPNRIYLNRYRNLMVGIVFNLTCNVKSEHVIK
jgi:hypothetical protein